MIRRPAWPAALLAGALAFAACSRPARQAAAGLPDGEATRQQVLDYLMRRPEVIDEAAARLEQKRHDLAMAAAAKAIDLRRAAIEHDPRDYVANPQGKVTVVEFFDYRCPYCKAALPQLEALIRENRDIRFVFKELPILPDADGKIGVSLRASMAAIAAARHGKYEPVHDALMGTPSLDDAGIVKALRDNGIDPAAAIATDDDDRHVQDVRDLAVAIGAVGTPSVVIGDTLVEGNRMDQLAAAIAQARKSVKG
jgi:protein-disulfide isomerase